MSPSDHATARASLVPARVPLNPPLRIVLLGLAQCFLLSLGSVRAAGAGEAEAAGGPSREQGSSPSAAPAPRAAPEGRLRVIVVTGRDYPGHLWRETAPVLADALKRDPRLEVHVSEDPNILASDEIHGHDVIVLHFMNWETPDPGPKARANLQGFVEGGKGLVIVHFACGAFQDWPEFRNLAGRSYDPKVRGHDPHGKFLVEITRKDHPITRGLEPFETVDELYTCLAGDRPIDLLATARSKIDGKDYPMAFAFTYGKGRVFHSPLGHDVRAFQTPAVGELLRRACAWAGGLPATPAAADEPQAMAGGARQSADRKLSFRHHFVDRDLPGDSWGQTALADLDGDKDLDFVTGKSRGPIRWYEYRGPDSWAVHPVTDRSPSDVGAVAIDVDRDGNVDIVAGGEWYRNPGRAGGLASAERWQAHVFDRDLSGVHDVAAADIDGDGRLDIATQSDRNDLRWYRIAADPASPWTKVRIGPSVHAGLALGDLDGDGDIDVVRSQKWYENLGKGERWAERVLTDIPWSPKESFPECSKAAVVDLNRDGRNDVVLTEAEINGARIAWFEAPADPRAGPWKARFLPCSDPAPRGPYHSLAVADFDRDGDLDIFSGEMEHLGERPHRWFIWTNAAGDGSRFEETVILDAGLGTHEAVAGDVDGDGDVDIVGKLWRPDPGNSNGGKNHVDFLENVTAAAGNK